jgi:hypothetical protein
MKKLLMFFYILIFVVLSRADDEIFINQRDLKFPFFQNYQIKLGTENEESSRKIERCKKHLDYFRAKNIKFHQVPIDHKSLHKTVTKEVIVYTSVAYFAGLPISIGLFAMDKSLEAAFNYDTTQAIFSGTGALSDIKDILSVDIILSQKNNKDRFLTSDYICGKIKDSNLAQIYLEKRFAQMYGFLKDKDGCKSMNGTCLTRQVGFMTSSWAAPVDNTSNK